MENQEEYLSKKRAIEMWDNNDLNKFEVGTTKGLKQIHKYLFQDVFDFAGEIRNVNISKGNFRFASHLYLEQALNEIDKMPENNFENIVDKYVEMNVAHPFREGNGCATRIWLDMMLKDNLQVCVDWYKVGKVDYLLAMERSPVNTLEIKYLLKGALTNKIYERQVYMRGIQQSYYYENFEQYSINEISKERDDNEDYYSMEL